MYRRQDASKLEVILWLRHDRQAIYRETTLHRNATRHLEYPLIEKYKIINEIVAGIEFR